MLLFKNSNNNNNNAKITKISNKMTPYDIFLLIDQCLTQASSEKCLYAADGNKYKGSQPDNVQRVRETGGRRIVTARGNGRHQGKKVFQR